MVPSLKCAVDVALQHIAPFSYPVGKKGQEKRMGQHQQSGLIAGIDVGGTFTDLVLVDSVTGSVRLAKTPSTPDNQAQGVMAALSMAEVSLATLDLIVHGTTTTTNAVLERKFARTGLITTQGFRDVLELGRRTRPAPYGMKGVFRPIIPRDLRLEIPERMDAEGQVVTPLDEDALRAALAQLMAAGCESLVIHFLHSYANPAHERRAAEIAREVWPHDTITAGHALLAESREFERGVTAAVNASVQPLLTRYLDRLRGELEAGGYANDLLIVNGNGGMVSSRFVGREAAKTVMSGPASGVMAAAYTGRRAGEPNLITYDMGGTSTDVSLIRDATPAVSSEIEVEYAMPIHLPMVDVRTVGAGGGSIARVSDAGLLEVGPDSAGAMPGPICYGRGGREPTISDANLLLGRLNPERLFSVDSPVTVQDVATVFAKKLGEPLSLDAMAAAAAVIRVANARMAGATRMVSVSLGIDPRDYALFAFGGAGPLHAVAIARELGIPRVLIPGRPGITNALGCAVADLRHDFVQTVGRVVADLDMEAVRTVLADHVAEGRALIAKEAVAVERVEVLHSAEMQFVGQTHLLRVPLPGAEFDRETLQSLFEEVYFERFRVRLPEIRASLVTLNTSVVGVRPEIDLAVLLDRDARGESLEAAQTGTRRVWFDGGWQNTPIYRRDALPEGATFTGPAIVEQMDTTVVIEPGDHVSQDRDGNLIVEVRA